MKNVNIKLEILTPYHRNARRGDVAAIAESLAANGQYKPIVVNAGTTTGRPNEVLVGNHTLQAAKQLEWERLQAVVIDVDDEQARRIVLADNRTSDLSGYDDSALLELLLEQGDLAGTAFTSEYLTDLQDSLGVLDLDAMGDAWDGSGLAAAGDQPTKIKLAVDSDVAALWEAHRKQHDNDTTALRELLAAI